MSDKRMEQLMQMLRESPNDSFLLFAIAKAHFNQSEFQEANSYFVQLESKDPNYTGMYLHWGNTQKAEGNLFKAKEIFEKGVMMCNKTGDFHAKAELLAALQDLEES